MDVVKVGPNQLTFVLAGLVLFFLRRGPECPLPQCEGLCIDSMISFPFRILDASLPGISKQSNMPVSLTTFLIRVE